MPLFLTFPVWLRPELVSAFPPLRWDFLLFLAAVAVTYRLAVRQLRKPPLAVAESEVRTVFWAAFLGLVVGARLVAALLDDRFSFLYEPWKLLWPFRWDGSFTGFPGLSFPGGVAGALIGGWLAVRALRQDWWTWADSVALALPLGLALGRLGSLLHGDQWGRVTSLPWGVVFPSAPSVAVEQPWVAPFLAKIGVVTSDLVVNLPRHPLALYGALAEGVALALVLRYWTGARAPRPGLVTAASLVAYGVLEAGIEALAEPAPATVSSLLAGPLGCGLLVGGGVLAGFLVLRRDRRPTGLGATLGRSPGPEARTSVPSERS